MYSEDISLCKLASTMGGERWDDALFMFRGSIACKSMVKRGAVSESVFEGEDRHSGVMT